MRRRVIFSCTAAVVLALTACGSSSPKATPTTSAVELSNPTWDKAGPNPSISAKMVCQKEARDEIGASLNVAATRVTTPTWVRKDHLYSCTYVFPAGKIALSVKELSDEKGTTAYFDGLRKKYGGASKLFIGQGGWILDNDDVVVRKDYKVLFVDVHALPSKFGPLKLSRSDTATGVATAILGCWTGA